MVKVMLIDDDMPMLDYLAHLLRDLDLDLELAASAASAKEALEKFPQVQPDLLITDIGLPGSLSGLDLAQTFRELRPELRIIFLTCYEDFHYSKRAIQLEADDYLIKDELTPEQLAVSIGKSLERLKGRREVIDKYAAHQDLERNRDLLRQAFLQEVLRGRHTEAQRRYGERLGIHWPHPLFRLGFLQLDAASVVERYRPEDAQLLTYAVYNIACELSKDRGRITPFQASECGILVVWNGEPEQDSGKLWLEQGQPVAGAASLELRSFLMQVQEKTAQFLQLAACGGYLPEAVSLGKLGDGYRMLMERREKLFYAAGPESGALVLADKGSFHPLGEERFERERELIRMGLAEGSPAWFDLAVADMQERSAAGMWAPWMLKQAQADLVRQIAYEQGQVADDGFVRRLVASIRLEEAGRLVKAELRRLLERLESERNAPEVRDIRLKEIDRYLEEHPGEMVTSQEMADVLHLNPSYFSRYFKRQAGISFTDYVNRHKIRLAVQLLSSGKETVENVAYTLGFSDRAYFSKVFKKYSGRNPSEYKGPAR